VLLLLVWIAVGVVTVVVLGTLAHSTVGALRRLGREAEALDREVRPVLEQLQDTLARRGGSVT
jgi:heme exporter protein D